MTARRCPEPNENRHKRTAQHLGPPRRVVTKMRQIKKKKKADSPLKRGNEKSQKKNFSILKIDSSYFKIGP